MTDEEKDTLRRLALRMLQIRVQSATLRGQSLMAYASGETDKAENLGRKAEKTLTMSFEAYDEFLAYVNKL